MQVGVLTLLFIALNHLTVIAFYNIKIDMSTVFSIFFLFLSSK